MKVAYVFQGQGSQQPNMGQDFYENYAEYKEVLDLVFSKKPELKAALACDDVHQTVNCQPLLLANQIGILNVIKSKYDIDFDATAGFSLGEYTAFYNAGVLNLDAVVDLVIKRAQMMDALDSDVEIRVVLGLTLEQLKELQKEEDLLISNVNLEKQILVGSKNFADLEPKLKELGAKRVMPLNLSGPFHTSEFDQIASDFAEQASVEFSQPTIDLYLNYNGEKFANDDFKEVISKQMCQSVLWFKQVQTMINDGVDTFVEIGSNPVVSNLIKKIDRSVNVITIASIDDLEKMEELCQK